MSTRAGSPPVSSKESVFAIHLPYLRGLQWGLEGQEDPRKRRGGGDERQRGHQGNPTRPHPSLTPNPHSARGRLPACGWPRLRKKMKHASLCVSQIPTVASNSRVGFQSKRDSSVPQETNLLLLPSALESCGKRLRKPPPPQKKCTQTCSILWHSCNSPRFSVMRLAKEALWDSHPRGKGGGVF